MVKAVKIICLIPRYKVTPIVGVPNAKELLHILPAVQKMYSEEIK